MCDDINFDVLSVDSTGAQETYSGLNHVNLPVPTSLPANITITNKEHSKASLELFYYDSNPLSVKLGSGPNSASPIF